MNEKRSGYRICHISDKMDSILRERRVILGMTQQQVADKAHIKIQQYQKFESGARNIMTSSFQLACRVIEALEMDISDFYHGEFSIGEEVYWEDHVLKYRKTGRPVDADVEPAEIAESRLKIKHEDEGDSLE